MGRHHRADSDAVHFPIDAPAVRGRHRGETTGPGTGMKAATVAAATGAILTAGAQFGAGSAAAAPDLAPMSVEFPQIQLPALPPMPIAQQFVAAVKATPIPAELPQVQDMLHAAVSAVEAHLGSTGSLAPRAVKPVSGTLTSDFGPRWGTHHNGIDIAAPIGTPVYAAADGVVVDAGPASGFGLWVRVQHDDGTTTVYGHVNDYQVGAGQRVAAGQQIATVGNRGQSTGPHLHFEVWSPSGAKIDPSSWLEERGVPVTWRGASATM